MTETHATTPITAPVFPPGRYGRRRAARRRRPWVAAALAVALVAVLGLVSVRLYRMYGDPNYQAEVLTYTQITDRQVVVDFRVTVPPGGSAVCVLRARSRDGAEVAREEVPVTAPAGERQVTVQHRLATTGRPLLGEVLRCRAAG
ncbi:DUF4307 domain-containing protein [Micromonospora zhanjiangensis]|uniref:DUF4307 domain-containing protein n=1 Tax=Micromonospora zhanjiangensis TaxID=1522057 RepID=A0ABV8KRY1_9ACTN